MKVPGTAIAKAKAQLSALKSGKCKSDFPAAFKISGTGIIKTALP